MPFPYDSSFVSALLEHVRQSVDILWYGQGRTRRSDPRVLSTEGIGSGEEGIASWGAGGGRAVAAGELQTILGKAVDVRGLQVLGFRSVTPDVSIAQIVCHDNDHVGFLGQCSEREKHRKNEKCGQSNFIHLDMRMVREIRGLRLNGKICSLSFKCIPKMFPEWILVKKALAPLMKKDRLVRAFVFLWLASAEMIYSFGSIP